VHVPVTDNTIEGDSLFDLSLSFISDAAEAGISKLGNALDTTIDYAISKVARAIGLKGEVNPIVPDWVWD